MRYCWNVCGRGGAGGGVGAGRGRLSRRLCERAPCGRPLRARTGRTAGPGRPGCRAAGLDASGSTTCCWTTEGGVLCARFCLRSAAAGMPLPLRAVVPPLDPTRGASRDPPAGSQVLDRAPQPVVVFTPLELRNARTLCPMAAGRIVPVIVNSDSPLAGFWRGFFARNPVRRAAPARPMGRVTRATRLSASSNLRSGRGAARDRLPAQEATRPPTPHRNVDPVPAAERHRLVSERAALGNRQALAHGEPAERLQIYNNWRPRRPGPVSRRLRPCRKVLMDRPPLPACVRCGGASSARDPWEQA